MTSRRTLLAVGLPLLAALVGVGAWALTPDGAGEGTGDGPTTTERSTTTIPASTTTTEPAPTSTLPGTTTTTAPPVATTAPAPPFGSSVRTVTAAELGASWHAGCPVGPDQLRALDLSHWGDDGAVHTGRLIVTSSEAERVVAVFRELYALRFPIHRMVPVDAYGGDDEASMRANNTSGFNCRFVAGTTTWSNHAYGRAIDVNPLVNPYVKGGTVDPPEGAPWADRSRTDPGMIHADDGVVRAFARQGWSWGGYWQGGQDYQHFDT